MPEDEIIALAIRLLSVLNEAVLDNGRTLAAMKIAKILFSNQHSADALKVIGEKFGLAVTN